MHSRHIPTFFVQMMNLLVKCSGTASSVPVHFHIEYQAAGGNSLIEMTVHIALII